MRGRFVHFWGDALVNSFNLLLKPLLSFMQSQSILGRPTVNCEPGAGCLSLYLESVSRQCLMLISFDGWVFVSYKLTEIRAQIV